MFINKIMQGKKKIIRKIKTYIFCLTYNAPKDIMIHGDVILDNKNTTFGNNVSIYDGVQIWGHGKVIIGNNVAIGKDTVIFSNKSVRIGDNTLIAGQCYIIDSDHGIDRSNLVRNQQLKSAEIFIGEDVWIGAGTIVLKNSNILNGSIIGAASLVNSTTEEYSINVGVPTRRISYRI